ncbi:MAG TPA: site-2 protease family protein [Chloroflexota bacterium]|nr:site-2 protease family protein [Chloroflexota bacterium]
MDRAMEPTLSAGRLFGVRINLSPSWFLIFALVTWTLSAGYFPAQYPWWPIQMHWVLGVFGSLAFFGSVVAHELAHAVVALRFGIPVARITLFLFGGLAQITREAATPKAEAAIAIAGPAASMLLAVIFAVAFVVARLFWEPAEGLCLWLATINGSLALFNLIPGFPLDGGRLLRALVWARTTDYRRATRISSAAGQVVGFLLVFVGLYMLTQGSLMDAFWLVLVGWFLHGAAVGSYRSVKVADDLKSVAVGDVMARDVIPVPADATVAEFVNGYLMRRRHCRYPVVRGIDLVGMVGLAELRGVAVEKRTSTWVAGVMRPVEQCRPLQPRDSGDQALQQLNELEMEDLPVVEDGRVVGILSRSELMRLVQTRQQLRR